MNIPVADHLLFITRHSFTASKIIQRHNHSGLITACHAHAGSLPNINQALQHEWRSEKAASEYHTTTRI
ncbi:hypothetical protein KDX31_12935 [Amphritea atlantica]|uniref:Uncharacterized protein n=1 Tax=Amphritea atlantica TaxID=355243 RepID=A0ABY5GRT0_9GAMM|nr:hypothetical protein KDX31_12935 [Amphritea atlantica]